LKDSSSSRSSQCGRQSQSSSSILLKIQKSFLECAVSTLVFHINQYQSNALLLQKHVWRAPCTT
jgi:hypothetical protein